MQADTMERPTTRRRVATKSSHQRKRYDLAKMAAQITDENRHGEVLVGPSVGHEFAG